MSNTLSTLKGSYPAAEMNHLNVNHLFVSEWTGLTPQIGDRRQNSNHSHHCPRCSSKRAKGENRIWFSLDRQMTRYHRKPSVWAMPSLPITGNDKQNNNKQQLLDTFVETRVDCRYCCFSLKMNKQNKFAFSSRKSYSQGNLEADKLKSELQKQQHFGTPCFTEKWAYEWYLDSKPPELRDPIYLTEAPTHSSCTSHNVHSISCCYMTKRVYSCYFTHFQQIKLECSPSTST